MAASEPRIVDDTIPDPESNPATATVLALNADIETLTTARDATETTPVKTTFKSAVFILTLVRVRLPVLFHLSTPPYLQYDQDEMINDDALVELAKSCARACNVLKNVTQGRDMNGLSSPSKKAVEDLGRYANPTNSFISMANDNERHQNLMQHRVHGHRTAGRHPRFSRNPPQAHRQVPHRVEDGIVGYTKGPRRT